MKLKIQKGDKTSEFNLITKWEDVTLDTYGKLIDFKKGNKAKEALHLIKSLSDMPKKYAEALSLSDITIILSKLAKVQAYEDGILQHIIRIDGVNYGFHPNLEEITLGEYADIEHFIEAGYENKLKEIMAVLYRPLTSRDGKKYSIEPYDGNLKERVKIFSKMSAKQVQGALVFFWSLGTESSVILQSYLMLEKMKNNPIFSKEILQQSGGGLE